MRRTFLLSIALVSLAASLSADRRPRYGGTLRVETRASLESAEALEPGLVFETLVRYDEKGSIQPVLATAWTHDVEKRRWVFTPRPNVILHNGVAWQPGVLSAPDDQPIEEILRGFARPRGAIIVKTADGQLLGTGPFKVAKFEAGKSVTLPMLTGAGVRISTRSNIIWAGRCAIRRSIGNWARPTWWKYRPPMCGVCGSAAPWSR